MSVPSFAPLDIYGKNYIVTSVQMDQPLASLAIKCALHQKWKEAIRINQELLGFNEEDVPALNRLAYAYLKSGNIASAKTTYKKVLKIDKYNPIALKNLKWLSHLTRSDIHQDESIFSTPTIFLEEPGKTKIVTLVHPAPTKVLCNLITAQRVRLIPRRHSIEVRHSTGNGKDVYVGALPDDVSHRLLQTIAAGNTYDAYIKNVAKNCVTVFVRELKRGKKFLHIPSFSVYTLRGENPATKESGNQQKPGEEDGES